MGGAGGMLAFTWLQYSPMFNWNIVARCRFISIFLSQSITLHPIRSDPTRPDVSHVIFKRLSMFTVIILCKKRRLTVPWCTLESSVDSLPSELAAFFSFLPASVLLDRFFSAVQLEYIPYRTIPYHTAVAIRETTLQHNTRWFNRTCNIKGAITTILDPFPVWQSMTPLEIRRNNAISILNSTNIHSHVSAKPTSWSISESVSGTREPSVRLSKPSNPTHLFGLRGACKGEGPSARWFRKTHTHFATNMPNTLQLLAQCPSLTTSPTLGGEEQSTASKPWGTKVVF